MDFEKVNHKCIETKGLLKTLDSKETD